jgi:hypothetical protein
MLECRKESDDSGLVLCYREKGKKDSLQLLYYDYQHKVFSHVNDVSRFFRSISCDEEAPLVMPLEGPGSVQTYSYDR